MIFTLLVTSIPLSWKFMIASDILKAMGFIASSMLKGPMSLSPTAIKLSAINKKVKQNL